MTSKITNFFTRGPKDFNETAKDKRDKRKLSSASSVEEGLSPIACQENKRLNFHDLSTDTDESCAMSIEDTLRSIEKKLSFVATSEDLNTLRKKFKERLDQMEGKFFEVLQKVDFLQEETHKLKAENQSLRNCLQMVERSQNDQEQYDRRVNLRVFNVQEERNESAEDCAKRCCEIFNDLLAVPTLEGDIEVAHRVGRVVQGGKYHRPIIVRFHSRPQRDKILAERRKLKGKGVAVGEDLTAANHRLEREAFKHTASMATWSSNGKIFAKLKNNKTVQLKYGDDVNNVLNKAMGV